MKALTLEEGKELVKAARHTVELYITTPQFNKNIIIKRLSHFEQKTGLFVTILHYPTRTLRGCIGFAEPVGPIKEQIIDSAIAAATEDPRFVPVSHYEFDDIILEVNVLEEPEILQGTVTQIKKQIKIGRDGLIIEYGYNKGLLLPSVAVDEHWNVEEFLDNLCLKAGMETHMWRQHGVVLKKFTTQTFGEISPRGDIEEVSG